MPKHCLMPSRIEIDVDDVILPKRNMSDNYYSIHPPDVVQMLDNVPPPSPLSSAPNTPINDYKHSRNNFSDSDNDVDTGIKHPPKVSRKLIPPSTRNPAYSRLPSHLTSPVPVRTTASATKKTKWSVKKTDAPFDENPLSVPPLDYSSTERTLRILKGETDKSISKRSLYSHDAPDDEFSVSNAEQSSHVKVSRPSSVKSRSVTLVDEVPDDEVIMSKRNILAEMDNMEENVMTAKRNILAEMDALEDKILHSRSSESEITRKSRKANENVSKFDTTTTNNGIPKEIAVGLSRPISMISKNNQLPIQHGDDDLGDGQDELMGSKPVVSTRDEIMYVCSTEDEIVVAHSETDQFPTAQEVDTCMELSVGVETSDAFVKSPSQENKVAAPARLHLDTLSRQLALPSEKSIPIALLDDDFSTTNLNVACIDVGAIPVLNISSARHKPTEMDSNIGKIQEVVSKDLVMPDKIQEEMTFSSMLRDAAYFSAAAASTLAAAGLASVEAAGEAVEHMVLGPPQETKAPTELVSEWKQNRNAATDVRPELVYVVDPYSGLTDEAFSGRSDDDDDKTEVAKNLPIDDLHKNEKLGSSQNVDTHYKREVELGPPPPPPAPSRSGSVSSTSSGVTGWWLEKELARRDREQKVKAMSRNNTEQHRDAEDKHTFSASPSVPSSGSPSKGKVNYCVKRVVPVADSGRQAAAEDFANDGPIPSRENVVENSDITRNGETTSRTTEVKKYSEDPSSSSPGKHPANPSVASEEEKKEDHQDFDFAIDTEVAEKCDSDVQTDAADPMIEPICVPCDSSEMGVQGGAVNSAVVTVSISTTQIQVKDVASTSTMLEVVASQVDLAGCNGVQAAAKKGEGNLDPKDEKEDDEYVPIATSDGNEESDVVEISNPRVDLMDHPEVGAACNVEPGTKGTTAALLDSRSHPITNPEDEDASLDKDHVVSTLDGEANMKGSDVGEYLIVDSSANYEGLIDQSKNEEAAGSQGKADVSICEQESEGQKQVQHDSEINSGEEPECEGADEVETVVSSREQKFEEQEGRNLRDSKIDSIGKERDSMDQTINGLGPEGIGEPALATIEESSELENPNETKLRSNHDTVDPPKDPKENVDMVQVVASSSGEEYGLKTSSSGEATSIASMRTEILSNKAPPLVKSLDDVNGICKGDAFFSLIHTKVAVTTDPLNGSVQVSNAVWRARVMRRCFTMRETGELSGNPATYGVSTLRNRPAIARARASLPVDVDNMRVVGALNQTRVLEENAIDHLRFDEFDDALELYDDILYAYNEAFKHRNETESGDFSVYRYIGNALHNMGIVNLLNQKYNEALRCFEEAAAKRKSADGVPNSDELTTLVKIALCNCALGNFSKAHSDLEQCLESSKGHCKTITDFIQISEILNNLGCLSFMGGDSETAMQMFVESLNVQHAVLSHSLYSGSLLAGHSTNLSMSITRANVAFLKMCSKDYVGAILAFESALITQQMLLYDAHETVVSTMEHLAASNQLEGNTEKAVNMLERILRALVQAHGPDDSRCEIIRLKMGMVHYHGTPAGQNTDDQQRERPDDDSCPSDSKQDKSPTRLLKKLTSSFRKPSRFKRQPSGGSDN